MPVETMELFFALLALSLATVVVFGALGLVFAREATMDVLRQTQSVWLELAAAVALVTTLGSLYMSEIAGYAPCRLCWVQRFFMYPAALLLVVAVATKQRALAMLAVVLAVIGLPVAIFHRVEQAVGGFGEALCDPNNPCSGIWVEVFGFMTIPTMAAIGFAGIIFFGGLSLRAGSLARTVV